MGSIASARDGDALLLPARELSWILADVVAHGDAVEQRCDTVLGLCPRAAQRLALGEADVVEHAEMREQLEMLEHHADAGAQAREVGALGFDRRSIDGDGAFLERLQRLDTLDEGGLAEAGGTAHHLDLAPGNPDAAT